jgi:hypothetical protein
MPPLSSAALWVGRRLVDRRGRKIGTIDAIYVDQQTGQPEFAGVKAGWFRTGQRLVPIRHARPQFEAVVVPLAKEDVQQAPITGHDELLNKDEHRELRQHYEHPKSPVGFANRTTGHSQPGMRRLLKTIVSMTVLIVCLVALSSTAFAADGYNEVSGGGAAGEQSAGGSLPLTGGDLAAYVTVGLIIVVSGFMLRMLAARSH